MSISSTIANDKLADLRNKKKLAIQALDFDAAEKYDELIQQQNEQIVATRIDKIKSEVLDDLEKHISKYNKISDEIALYNKKQENQLNQTYQTLLDKTQLQHAKELKSIDKSHAIALRREAEREVPEQIEILEQAKAAAVAGNYNEARNLRDEARRTGERELEERKNKIDEEFEHSRMVLDTKQQEAQEQIQQKYDDEIANLQAEIQMRTKETEQRFNSGVELIKQRAEIKVNSLLADDEVKEEAIFVIRQEVDNYIRQSQEKPQSSTMRSSRSNRTSPRESTQNNLD